MNSYKQIAENIDMLCAANASLRGCRPEEIPNEARILRERMAACETSAPSPRLEERRLAALEYARQVLADAERPVGAAHSSQFVTNSAPCGGYGQLNNKPRPDQLDMSVDAMELAQHKGNEERAELGIDGNAAFALLGEDIQSGECEFVELMNDSLECKISGCHKAMRQLRARLGRPELSYYFGKSHPYGG